MSEMENAQKVQVVIKEKICSSLIRKHIKQGDQVVTDKHNTALLKLIIGQGGEPVIGYITPDNMLAIDGGAYGFDGYIMVNYDFVEIDEIVPLNANYHKGKMYRMQDSDNTIGFFNGCTFDAKEGSIICTITSTTMERITGKVMIELDDEQLEVFGQGDRFDYYVTKEKK